MVDRGMMTKDKAIGWIDDIICGPETNGRRDVMQGFLTGRDGHTSIIDKNRTYVVHLFYEGKNIREFDPERYELIKKVVISNPFEHEIVIRVRRHKGHHQHQCCVKVPRIICFSLASFILFLAALCPSQYKGGTAVDI
jgi:hypothetical protein